MKILRCSKQNIFQHGGANRYCLRDADHPGPCEIVQLCPTCNGAGLTGLSETVAPPAAANPAPLKVTAQIPSAGAAGVLNTMPVFPLDDGHKIVAPVPSPTAAPAMPPFVITTTAGGN